MIRLKLLLVSGGNFELLKDTLSKHTIVNLEQLALGNVHEFIERANPSVDAVLVTDEAFSWDMQQDRSDLERLMQLLFDKDKSHIPVLLLTRDLILQEEWQDTIERYENLKVRVFRSIRLTVPVIRDEVAALQATKKTTKAAAHEEKPSPSQGHAEGEKRKSFLDRFRSRKKETEEFKATDPLTRRIEALSRGISRIVAITGHRGSGITSSAVNIASEASKRGLSAILIDLDIDYRGLNMYFSSFHEMTKRDEEMSASLIRTLARPQDYKATAFHVKDQLWLSSLGYEFADRRLVEQFYNNNKLIGMLSVLRTQFNLVLLDLPLDVLAKFQDTMIHIDRFGLCVPNNLHGIISTIRNAEAVLSDEQVTYLNAKSQIVITRYQAGSKLQDEPFTPDKVSEIMASGLSPLFSYEMATAGTVPYSEEFDNQIETDMPIAETSTEFEQAYAQILLRLLEGAP